MKSVQQRIEELKSELGKFCTIQLKKFPAGTAAYEAYAVKDMDELLDWLIEQSPDHPDVADERLPYWAEVWPSSLGLATYLRDADWITPEMSVLELGCGPGIAGLGAAHRTKNVTVSDYQPEALELAELNWLHNAGRSPEKLLLDWRYPDEKFKYDILLAADVAYEKRFFEPLLNTFRKMTRPGGSVVLSEPGRAIAKDFFDLMEKQGWSYSKENLGQVGGQNIDIYRITIT